MNRNLKCRAERHMRGCACQERRRWFGRGRARKVQARGPRQNAGDLHTRLPRNFRSSRVMPKATSKAKPSAPKLQPVNAPAPATTAEATIGALTAHGIDTVYALPGVHNDHLFDALFKAGDRIRTVHARHEQG